MHFFLVFGFSTSCAAIPEGFVLREVFRKNMKSRNVSSAVELAIKAVREKDWKDVLMHGMHHASLFR
jgi:hypothetical protein